MIADIFKQYCVSLSLLTQKMMNTLYLGDQVISNSSSSFPLAFFSYVWRLCSVLPSCFLSSKITHPVLVRFRSVNNSLLCSRITDCLQSSSLVQFLLITANQTPALLNNPHKQSAYEVRCSPMIMLNAAFKFVSRIGLEIQLNSTYF